jgi:hypothetical protein
MVTPRTARYLLVGIVAACISATAALAVLDAGRPVASTADQSQTVHFHIPSYAPGSYPSISIGSSSSAAQGNRVTLLPSDIVVTPGEGSSG